MNQEAVKNLLTRLGDDELVIGHRNSEWTGLGPILEEDIAFSSMAQDEIGHAQAYYSLIQEFFGGPEPDVLAFQRKETEFLSCHLVEYPIGDYAFSLMRHLLYDLAEHIRLEDLNLSSFAPLAELSKKIIREEKYHILHARTWIQQLSQSSDEAKQRLQDGLNRAWPLAYSIFEPTPFDEDLKKEGICLTETELKIKWEKECTAFITSCNLRLPEVKDQSQFYGGRNGKHSPHLASMLKEMTEVLVLDPNATW